MYKIGVIGDRESVQGFTALGLTTFAVTGPEEANAVLKSPEALEYAVLFITETLAASCEHAIALHRQSRTPAAPWRPRLCPRAASWSRAAALN